MFDKTSWWTTSRADLLRLIDQLRPDDALAAIRRALDEKHEGHALAALSGAVRGSVARRIDEQAAVSDDQVNTAIAVLNAYVAGTLQTDLCDELDAAIEAAWTELLAHQPPDDDYETPLTQSW